MATLPILNGYLDDRLETYGDYGLGGILPALGGVVDARMEEWGAFMNLRELPQITVELLDRNDQYAGGWIQLREVPQLAIELVEQASVITSHPSFYVLMRGKNTGGGAAWVYWYAEDGPDFVGNYYNGSVPFSQLTDIVWAATRYLS